MCDEYVCVHDRACEQVAQAMHYKVCWCKSADVNRHVDMHMNMCEHAYSVGRSASPVGDLGRQATMQDDEA